jgi:putative tricarboxylic transport membrane protein
VGFFDSILLGFQVMLDPGNLLFCGIGVVLGTMIGVLPGIGPTATMAILLPVTFRTTPTESIIMLTGIFYGAMYGGSTTSILVNIPGEAASVVTCIDGYQMARKGRAGPALGIAAWGSFIAGTSAVLGLMFVTQPLAQFALRFGPPEYFAIMCIGLVAVTYLAQRSVLKAIMMAFVGILIGAVGVDMMYGTQRFTFGIDELLDGVGIFPILMGLFGISEVLENLEQNLGSSQIYQAHVKNLWPSLEDWARAKWSIVRGTILGFIVGLIPGGGVTLSSFISYAVEKKVSKHPEEFGKGAIEGVAGPESANNACTGGCMIPLLSLGVPTNVTMAVLFSAFVIHGIAPGPLFIKAHPDIFWGLIASMWVGNVLLLVLNLPLIGLWVQFLKIPYRILFPIILLFCLIGAYTSSNASFDLILMAVFGVLGYLMKKFGYEAAPLVLAVVLGPIMEANFRQSLVMSQGSFLIFFSRPISGITLGIAALLLISTIVPFVKRKYKKYQEFKE